MKPCTHPGCKVCGRIRVLPPGFVADPMKLGREDAALDHALARPESEGGIGDRLLPDLDAAIERLVSAGLIGKTQRAEYKRGYLSYRQERTQ